MAIRIGKVLESVAEFVSRLWPIGRTEDEVLEEQRRIYKPDPRV